MTPSLCRNSSLALVNLLWFGALGLVPANGWAEEFFAEQVAPIFAQHCVSCHSDSNRKGEISLSQAADLWEQQVVVPGRASESYLLELVQGHDDEPPEMPQEGEPLTDKEVQILRQWIEDGAEWPEGFLVREKPKADQNWWAFQPLHVDAPSSSTGSLSDLIDQFVSDKLAERGLVRNPPAQPRDLIRRAYYDLTGLPPSPEEVSQFVQSQDPQAFEKVIDRLLASPRYGERWGRHWLDVVRFGESNGFERNVLINDLWPFRDYVIQSINEDKRFDEFIREHIAGDVLKPEDLSSTIASAFLVAGPYDDVGNQDAVQAAQIRANTLDEMIRAASTAFLGLTVGCARCHDHKFDPITQEDYYALYATFSGVSHGSVPLATPLEQQARRAQLNPLEEKRAAIEGQLAAIRKQIVERGRDSLESYQRTWTRPPIDRSSTIDEFEPVFAKFVRFVCEARDDNPAAQSGFGIDELEIWTPNAADSPAKNVALASEGAVAFGAARRIEDFPGAYGPQLAIDGEFGARFIAAGADLTIELPELTQIQRVVFSSARGAAKPEQGKFRFVAEYRIEVSEDGKDWLAVASSQDREPIDEASFLDHRLVKLATTQEDTEKRKVLQRELAEVKREISRIPSHSTVFVGKREATKAAGPFHVFLGGDPQRPGAPVVAAGLSVFDDEPASGREFGLGYELAAETPEAERRIALARWITHPSNPLTPRVLANRIWQYHFGTGIVDTPSDFGYMGGKPTHPELLDLLARAVQRSDWKIKSLHRAIMLSETYRQSTSYRESAANEDGDARLLWRFPPRRLSAEEIRDTMLQLAGQLHFASRGPGFRLYQFMQDNVSTYVPLDEHGPETYRRAVYHQNARASVVDLMTEFDQPDCTFATPQRATTTTPLQALTMLNHSFTSDMAAALERRVQSEADQGIEQQIGKLFQLCYLREPTALELDACRDLAEESGLAALCRVVLNTSELIYLH